MKHILLVIIVFSFLAVRAGAEDVEYIRAIESAQEERPGTIANSARIAPANEPGQPMIFHGRIVKNDGTPAAGAIVFGYHTDAEGRYDRAGAGPHRWRLRGWAKTDANGRFTFETIRPGSYPGRTIPAHLHCTIFLSSGERYHSNEVRFADDPKVTQAMREATRIAGDFGDVRPVHYVENTEVIDFAIRLDPAQKF